jgi:hypothetical protein
MKLKAEKLGKEPKKLAILGALLLVAGYFYFSNSDSGGSSTPARRPAAAPAALPVLTQDATDRAATSRRREAAGGRESLGEWIPSLKPKKDFDPSKVDPTLQLALLDKLKQVPLEGGQRSLFDFSAAPVKEAPPVVVAKGPPKGLPAGLDDHGQPPKPPEPATPTAPPIPLKFYGFVSATDNKRAFFLDGDDILVVRIGVSSAVLEDEQFKSQQTISLVQQSQEG